MKISRNLIQNSFIKNMKNTVIVMLISLTTLSCTLQDNFHLSGVVNLKEKQKILQVNTSNKNDVINLFGESVFVEFQEKNTWLYGEIVSKKSFFGKNKILKSNLLYLDFNNRGILVNKRILDKEKLRDIEFSAAYTSSKSLSRSFSKKLFNSLKKRYQNKINTN
jgi:outer membrane protein assembly factor BamE (lipoprotein component of BamABCDE complex)